MPRVRIDGNLLATLAMRAAPMGTAAAAPVGTATTMVGSVVARIGGRAIARQGDFSQVSPTSAMAIVGGKQSVVAVAGASVPEVPGVDAAGAAMRVLPPRTNWTDPSPTLRMLSRCSPARWTDLVPREHAVLVGDPVDVATGAVVTDSVDFELVTPRVELRRHYVSNRCDRDGAFGRGWGHGYECMIWLEPGRVVLREGDGREIEFDAVGLRGGVARAGDVLVDPAERIQLFCRGRFRWELRERGRIRQFGPIPGESAKERDRGLARLVRIVREHELTQELRYDEQARLREIVVGDRSVLSLEYDDHGRIASLWTPIGERLHRHAHYGYSPDGDLVDVTDAMGGVRSYEYAQHLLVRETDPAGASFYYGYDGFGPAAKCVRTWGTGGRLDRVLAYEARTTLVTDSLGNVTTYRCDPLGLVREVIDPLGDATRYRYDAALRLVQVVYADGTSVTDSYDDRGNLVQRKGPGDAVWKMRYDEADHCVEAIDCMGGHWRYGWDGGGRLARVEDPLGHLVRVEYEDGRLARIVDPMGRATEVEVDAEQRVVALAVPGRLPLRFDYDGNGRLAAVVAATGDRVAWSYDPLNRPIAIETRDESVRFDRDVLGRVVAVHRPSGTVSVRRDAFGTIETIEHDGVVWACANDDEGRLVGMRRDGVVAFSAQYDPRGLVSVFTRGEDEPWLVLRRLRSRRIECIVDGVGTTRLQWDDAGRIVSIEAHDGSVRRFEYRADGLLVTASDDTTTLELERDVRGAVLRQRQGGVTIDAGTVDHRGRPHGLDVDDRVHISCLRDNDGELERIAVVSEGVHDIRVERSPGRAERIACEARVVEIHRDAWGRALALPRAVATGIAANGPTDALLRPRGDRDRPLVWDEDRLLCAGDTVRVVDPDANLLLAEIHGADVELALHHDAAAVERDWPWLALGSDPLGIDAVCPTPLSVLHERFDHRAWNPEVRPVTGMVPWDPDQWTCRIEDPAVVDGRLDQAALARLLCGPFPRSALRPGTP